MSEPKSTGRGRSLDHIFAMLDDIQFQLAQSNTTEIARRFRSFIPPSSSAEGPDARTALLTACLHARDEHRKSINSLIEKLSTEQQALKHIQAVVDAF